MWKNIKNYEGLYQVDKKGNIKSLITNKILKPGITSVGYYSVSLRKNKKSKTFLIHSLVLNNFEENINNKRTINHKDGNKLNNNLDNLEYLTDKEQMKHALNTGLLNNICCENNHNSKLARNDVFKIIEMKKNKIKQKVIMKLYNISRVHIWRICNNKRWGRKNVMQTI